MKPDDFNELLRVQRMMSERVMQEQRTDNKILVLNALQELGAAQKPIQVEALIIEIQASGVSANETQDVLEDLQKDGLIRRARGGFVQLT